MFDFHNWVSSIKLFRKKIPKINPYESFKHTDTICTPWWGTFQVEEGQSRFWKVGKVIIFVNRFTNEWNLASCQSTVLRPEIPEASDPSDKLAVPSEMLKFKTFTFKTQAEITLMPALADRPLASKLETPLYIPGDEEILLYVSSPVWVKIETGKTKITLDEIPTFLLSDTWFGKNTLEGELCYAGQTFCSPRLNELPYGPDRIVVPMLIKNRSRSFLVLEKISVPLPYLSVYRDHHNYLWTDLLSVKREHDEIPEISIEKGPPKMLKNTEIMSPARRELRGGSGLSQFFNFLVGH